MATAQPSVPSTPASRVTVEQGTNWDGDKVVILRFEHGPNYASLEAMSPAQALVLAEQLITLASSMEDPEPHRPRPCENCGTSYDDCTTSIRTPRVGAACCTACSLHVTHDQDAWEDWKRRQES